MAEWLKELALFDHLLHGLFKFLGETTLPGKKNDLEGRVQGLNKLYTVEPVFKDTPEIRTPLY